MCGGIIFIKNKKSMEIKKIEINNDNNEIIKSIDDIMSGIEYSPIWQTIGWNEMLKNSNYIKKGIFIWVYENNILEAYVILEKRNIWFWFFWFFIVWWPIYRNKKYLFFLGEEIIKVSKSEKVVFTQVEPIEEIKNEDMWIGYKYWYYKNFIVKNTILIDLLKSEEEILKDMKPKWRYNIHVAEKNNVIIKKVENNEENLNIFYNLLSETNKRDNFHINSKLYFREFLKYLYEQDIGWLYFALKNEQVIASGIFVFFKKTGFYYYWASSSDNLKRKFMATYLIQWNALKEAKNKWCNLYDFLWIAWLDEKNSPLIWVTDFKFKFSSNVHKFPKSLIYINNCLIYFLFWAKNKVKLIFNKKHF